MSKRVADKEINHDNWNEEEESEDAGTFQQASADVIKSRLIKTAKRRVNASETDSPSKTIFSGFSFTKNPIQDNIKQTDVSSGLFGNGQTKTPLGKVDLFQKQSSSESIEKKSNADKDNNEFYAQLKGLNESVSKWIKSHVDANPICILTPVFRDYEKYLKEIQDKHEKTPKDTTLNKQDLSVKETPASSSMFSKDTFKNITTTSVFSTKTAEENKSSSVSDSNQPKSKDEPKKNLPMFNTGSATFSFGKSSTSPPSALPTAGFSFGTGAPFTFGNVTNPVATGSESANVNTEEEAESDEPPKAEFKAVVEEDSVYTVRCKVFVKKDGTYVDGGVGNLFLKPVKDRNKTQLIVRADTNLGNLLVNVLLSDSIPTQRMGTNNVMMVCIPTPEKGPTPTSILLRVKTADKADELLDMINKYKC